MCYIGTFIQLYKSNDDSNANIVFKSFTTTSFTIIAGEVERKGSGLAYFVGV